MPRQLFYVYEWFNLVSRGRKEITALTWSEIGAWARLQQVELEPFEIDIILRLDRVWLSVCQEKGNPFEEISDEHEADEARQRDQRPPRTSVLGGRGDRSS
jgi:hypothetical protein